MTPTTPPNRQTTRPPDTPAPLYLDNNATTRPLPEVIEVVARHLREDYGNPGSRHALGRRARRVLEGARETVAAILNAEPQEVVFTSGGTEASNMAILGCCAKEPSVGAAGTILLTAGEHPATIETVAHLRVRGWNSRVVDVDADGRLRNEILPDVPWHEIRFATVILAHNETGVIQDLGPMSMLCAKHGVPLHVDAVQAVGKIAVDFKGLGATTLALGAHKFHGPRGIGALLVRRGVRLAATAFGGHQEEGRRPGTECVALAAGMARALELSETLRKSRSETVRRLRDRFEAELVAACPPVVLNGSRDHRLPNTAHVGFLGLEAESLLVALDLAGVCCSLGSTCASGAARASPVLAAMGLSEEIARSCLRFSLSVENTEAEIDEAVRRIAETVRRSRNDR